MNYIDILSFDAARPTGNTPQSLQVPQRSELPVTVAQNTTTRQNMYPLSEGFSVVSD